MSALLQRYPELSEDHWGRPVYFDIPLPEHDILASRGYKIVYLSTMKRGAEFETEYLRAKLQAVEEGTIVVSKDQLDALKKSCDIAFGKNADKATKDVKKDLGDLLKELSWTSSRHTVKGNSTQALVREAERDS